MIPAHQPHAGSGWDRSCFWGAGGGVVQEGLELGETASDIYDMRSEKMQREMASACKEQVAFQNSWSCCRGRRYHRTERIRQRLDADQWPELQERVV